MMNGSDFKTPKNRELAGKDLIRLYENFVFDLDNTLYDERQYLYVAYRAIADSVAKSTSDNPSTMFTYLKDTFERHGRKNLFDKFLRDFDLPKEQWMSKILNILRNVDIKEPLSLFPEMARFLMDLKIANKQIFIVTNGNAIQQRNKIRLLDWPIDIPDHQIYLANDYEPKPSPRCLLAILENPSIIAQNTVFIGDSVEDEQCARAAGVDFYNIQSLK